MKTIHRIQLILIVCATFIFLISCVKEHEPVVSHSEYNFSDISLIFDKNSCSNCHGNITKSYYNVIANWVDKNASPEKTVLYNAIKSGGPMNGYISNYGDIDVILEWIQEGAAEGNADSACVGTTDTVYLELPAFISYDESIKPLFSANCLGCHHNEDEIVYEQLFTTNSQGHIWLEPGLNYSQALLYDAIKSGGPMSSYFSSYERNVVVQWMSYGAIKNI